MVPVALATLLVGLVPIADVQANADGPQVQNVDPMVIEGAVVSASAGQLSLRAADGKEHSFKPNAMTRIMVNGKPGKLEDLKAGVQVRVMVDKMAKVVSISTVDDRK
jgi:hypothetical protein